jgi:sugar-specific transcriptional regulator TrmB
MRALLFITLLFITTSSFASTLDELKRVAKEYGAEIKKETPEYGLIDAKASNAINLIKKMSAQEAEVVVQLLQFNEAVDPGRTVFDSTYEVLSKNKAALDAAFKKLPKKEADSLRNHIRIAVEANTKGQD